MSGEMRFIFRAQDYDAAVAFYRDGLEFPIISSWDRGPTNRGTLFQVGKGVLEVLSLRPGEEYRSLEGLELAYEVEDVEAWYERVGEKDLPIIRKLEDKPWGHRAFSIKDPDALKVMIFTVIEV
jgi:catechol 2,3-dioxygenase-like lactoylglutathione lyase family enzyme